MRICQGYGPDIVMVLLCGSYTIGFLLGRTCPTLHFSWHTGFFFFFYLMLTYSLPWALIPTWPWVPQEMTLGSFLMHPICYQLSHLFHPQAIVILYIVNADDYLLKVVQGTSEALNIHKYLQVFFIRLSHHLAIF